MLIAKSVEVCRMCQKSCLRGSILKRFYFRSTIFNMVDIAYNENTCYNNSLINLGEVILCHVKVKL